MRFAAVFLVATTLSIAAPAAAQVSVTAPAAGKESSYRKTTISWAPIPGATSYHLEIDDDPNFGSPEVDVTVAGTSYTLSGERLELHGQHSWAAYVRINGKRWNANTFTASYWKTGSDREPALAVDSHNRVYIAFNSFTGIHLTTSSDWSSNTPLSHDATNFSYGHNIAVDEYDVVHASWIEGLTAAGPQIPYYTNSSTAWNLVPLPGPFTSASLEGSILLAGGQVDVFHEAPYNAIFHWTSTNGVDFAGTTIPNNNQPLSVSAGRDAVGNFYVASQIYATQPNPDLYSALQSSSDGWTQYRLGTGRLPSLTVTASGELHVLERGFGNQTSGHPVLYSNSLRGFQTWTELPIRNSQQAFDLLPLVIDEPGRRLYTAIAEGTIDLCSAPYGGSAIDTGTSWTCRALGSGANGNPDLALAPDGTLHIAWEESSLAGTNLAYANSLGSFAATNLTPQVNFGTPSSGPSAVTVPVTISDADGDEMAGHIQVGRYQPVMSLMEPGTAEKILDSRYTLANQENAYIYDSDSRLQFRVVGSATWVYQPHRSDLTLPAEIEVRDWDGQIVGGFFIASWDGTGVTIVQNGFVPYQKLTFSGALPSEIDISPLPVGSVMLAIGVSDKVTSSFAAQAFTKTAGQTRLLLTKP